MKIMVIGGARHGKDSMCNILRDLYGFTFCSSSFFVAEKAVIPYLAARGITYPDIQTAYDDRINHRSDWFDVIAEYNKDDLARLGKELYKQYDIYCGLRNINEFNALKEAKSFDVCFWVDRSLFVEPEPASSNTLHSGLADFVIDNNSSLHELVNEIQSKMEAACEFFNLKLPA